MFYNCPECGYMIFDADIVCDKCGKEIDWKKVEELKKKGKKNV
jgi:uncharacterized OB-fold protein